MNREEYQRYLCSREWGLLKKKVHERAGGVCERCFRSPINAVHHLTYERQGHERLEDLQGLCNLCHGYTHGHTDVDPAAWSPELYLAGKIAQKDWRHDLVPYLEEKSWDERVRGEALGRVFYYTGPFFEQCGGHGCGHGENSHGNGIGFCSSRHDAAEIDREEVFRRCLIAIGLSDALFAWIDTNDCYGTLTEIGYAAGSKRLVIVAFQNELLAQEMWFARQHSELNIVCNTAADGLAQAIDYIKNTKSIVRRLFKTKEFVRIIAKRRA